MKLKELRKSKGISQEQAANALGISVRAYQNYEYAQREPNIEMILKLADFYNVSTDYLLGREPQTDPIAMLNVHSSEKSMIEKYTSLPPEVRQILLDVLIQLADSAKIPYGEESGE